MIVLLIDSSLEELEAFVPVCEACSEISAIKKFEDGEAALEFAKEHTAGIVVMEARSGQLDGLALGKKLRELYPELVLIYATAHTECAAEAMLECKADEFIIKPCIEADVVRVINNAVLLSKRMRPRITVRTFGRFDVFVDEHLMVFTNKKAKELLALCVDRKGGRVLMEDATDKLWPDRPYDERAKRLYRKAVSALHNTLREYGASAIFYNEYGKCYIWRDMITCDYYEYLKSANVPYPYNGIYMFEYSWAEETNAFLEELHNKRRKENVKS